MDRGIPNGMWNWRENAGVYGIAPVVSDEAAAPCVPSSASSPADSGALCEMPVAEFVERKFVPEYIAQKSPSGRMHYQAMLKHVLRPEEVNRMFPPKAAGQRDKLHAVPGWPYLSAMRLCDVGPDDVQRLVEAAFARGYSTQTATHILNVVNAIFSHAAQVRYWTGDSPVRQVRRWQVTRKVQPPLTLAQLKAAAEIMKNPEREMMLIAILTGMNVSEICGLQWKYVNLSGEGMLGGDEQIPPLCIAVRRQWFRGELGPVKRGRIRNVQIPALLLPVLSALKSRPRFVGQDDFVLVSRVGTPVNHANILVRRLKPLARQLGAVSLSWHVLQNSRKAFAAEFGRHFHDAMAGIVRLVLLRATAPVLSEIEPEAGRGNQAGPALSFALPGGSCA